MSKKIEVLSTEYISLLEIKLSSLQEKRNNLFAFGQQCILPEIEIEIKELKEHIFDLKMETL